MARVEWSALSGDDVEAVLSNLLYNFNNRALRIRPSQGDFGIDVIVPEDANTDTWDVYQIKKFALNLSASQKAQVERSFGRALVGLLRRGVPLNNWHLVMPLDPTLENLLDWFQAMPEKVIAALAKDEDLKLSDTEELQARSWLTTPGRVISWKGLDFCQMLASEHPYVVDYYLHGGKERLREAVAELATLLGRDMSARQQEASTSPGEGVAALLQPGEIREHLLRLDRVLDTDPHFRYGHSLELNRPELHPEPYLIAATQEAIPGGRWLTFKIYERSAQSLDERPIPLELTFNFEDSPEDLEQAKLWHKYGKPFEATASMKADLPGGLHGAIEAGRVRLSPADGEETIFRNRLRIVTADREPLATLSFEMASTTGVDRTGSWAHGEDTSRTLAAEMFVDVTAKAAKINFAVEPLAGLEASKVIDAVTFASHLASPHLLQIAAEYGAFHDVGPIGADEPPIPQPVVRIVKALATIQTRTSVPVLIPDFGAVGSEDLALIRRAASLIEGHTIVGTWDEITIETDAGIELEPSGHYGIAVIEPLVVSLDGHELPLGGVQHKALSATVNSIDGRTVRMVPGLNNIVHADFVLESLPALEGKRRVQYRQLPAPHPDSGTS